MPEIVCRIVEVCVFTRDQSAPQYLLLQRAHNDTIYPGTWQVVTGSIDIGERAVDAARRELKEETGLAPTHFWVVPLVNSFYVAADDLVHLTTFFAVEVSRSKSPALSREHQSFEWCSYEDAKRKLVWPGQRRGLEIVQEYIIGGQEAGNLTEIKL